MSDTFTLKQQQCISDLKNNRFSRINIFQGAVSSGKTYISLIIWALWVCSQPETTGFLMVGATLDTLESNCLMVLVDIFGEHNIKYSIAIRKANIFGKEIILRGANDERAERKVRGVTLKGAYLDEITLMPESFFNMVITRLRRPNAKLFGTTNPDRTNHWLKVNFLDKSEEKNIKNYFYAIDDNTFLDADYVEDMKNMFTGVFFERFILGLWVNAEGLIYKLFADKHKQFKISKEMALSYNYEYINIGLDFGGNKSNNAIVCTGITKGYKKLVLLKSHRFKGSITPSDLEKEVCKFIKSIQDEYKTTDFLYCDSAETMLINGVRQSLQSNKINVANASKKPIIDRIRFMQKIINNNMLELVENETDTIEEALTCALWNDKSLKDERLDDNTTPIDDLDACEYTFERYMKLF